ncbi:MAG: YCF48-related protein [Gemmatales bacterium]
MLRHGLAGFVVCLTTLGLAQAHEAPATADAPLYSMHMVDGKEGWAVGDDGLILHTLDGWESFETQHSGVRASLRSVQFVDAYIGFAVGMEVLPYGRGTGGVILGTRDGGATWTKLIQRELPGLQAVKFVDGELGYAFGDTNGGNPGGMFRTENGGRSWVAIPALDTSHGWTTGTLVQEQPIGMGPAGSVGILEKDQVLSIPIRGCEKVCLNAMACKDHDVWAVGTQATVLLSRQTGGKSWEIIKLPMREQLMGLLDFNAVCCFGSHVWIAGRPGSVVFHSWDNGKSWEAQRTSQPMPLHGLCFVSETQGYALGELGTILLTKDSGKTWQVARRGGHRSAAMFVSSSAQQIPVGTIAAVGGDQGYLCVGVQATHQPGRWQSDRDQLRQAVRVVGGTSSEVLSPMVVADYQQYMKPAKMVELTEQQHLLEQMVLALRMWRPSVVICDSPEALSAGGPTGAAVALALRQACDLCSRADIYPDHFTKLDLQPWQPARLFTRKGPSGTTDCVVHLEMPRPVLFASANDFANLARPLVNDHYVRGPMLEEYTLWKAWTEMPSGMDLHHSACRIPLVGIAIPFGSEARVSLFAGLSLGHGGQARREIVDVDSLRYQLLEAATEKQRVEALPFQAKMFDAGEARRFFINFEHSLNGLARITQGDRIAAQAQDFVEKGQWTMARECHLMLLDLFPTHRLAPESCRFVTMMMGSSEIRRRADAGQMKHFTDYVLRSPASKLGDPSDAAFERQLMSQRTILQRRRLELRRWSGGALAAGEVYSVLHPLGYGDPDLQFCLLANQRLDGREEQSELMQSAFQWKYSQGVWSEAASAEQWLKQRIGTPTKPTMQAVRIAEMPKLDGKLDDAVWKKVPATTLKTTAGECPEQTTVQFAFDDTYLYVAVECQQPRGMPVLAPVKPRKRDDDLRSYDRISLLFDIDRDYGTYFHMEFDSRGCVMEECCGDMTWNPKWFVEACPGSEGWTAEVAIPLVELTGKLKLENEVWAANVTRIIPGMGVQAASMPAGVKPKPEGMGLLLFGDTVMKAGK